MILIKNILKTSTFSKKDQMTPECYTLPCILYVTIQQCFTTLHWTLLNATLAAKREDQQLYHFLTAPDPSLKFTDKLDSFAWGEMGKLKSENEVLIYPATTETIPSLAAWSLVWKVEI